MTLASTFPPPAAAPFREAHFMPVDLDVARRADGVIVLRSRVALLPFEANLPKALAQRVATAGDKTALAARGRDGDWRHTSYNAFKRDVDAVSQWLIDNAPRGAAVLALAANSVEAATLTFACYGAGMAFCPVGVAFGATGGDYARLRHVIAKVRPKLIYVDADPALARAIAAVAGDIAILTPAPALLPRPATAWDAALATAPTPAVAASIEAIRGDDTASYMLTSGSTGLPKLVPLSFANLAANTQQCLQAIGAAAGWSDVMLDWLPWHHAAGASVLRTTLLEGGSLYIDGGKPAPGLYDETIRNLREIPVAYHNNVPLGYAMLVEALESDAILRRTFFERLRLMLYGGAGLAQHVHDRLQSLAVAETGCRIMMTTGYGMTETVSGCMAIYFQTDRVGIGLPTPGLSVKLAPYDARYEVRLKGPNVMRGYLDEPEKNAAAFDDEGYYRTGDLATFQDPDHPEQGLAFAGRLAEEFKLSNGAWVHGGQMRERLLKALSPLVADLVLGDDSRPYLTALLWPKPDADAALISEQLKAFNAAQQGATSVVRRVVLLDTPPSAAALEVSDKGTINRRAVLDRRSDIVDAMYADPPGVGVIVLG